LFVGSTELRVAEEEGASLPTGGGLAARQDDDIVLEYRDNAHMEGDEARDVVYQVRVLAGDIQDVKIEHRLVASQELKARKDLIEARIFLKLGQIFKDVGLNRQASEKAGEGLARAESVIREGLKAGLDRELVEQAFNAKWDLLMVQDKLGEAIAVCNALIRMFPDSTLVDQALMRVAKAKLETEREKDRREAVNILTGVLRLKQSDLKPEAQFMMAELAEQEARARARARDGAEPDLSRALMAYKQCADLYPESPFAGESLDRIANYYLKTRDYARAVELIEQVFQDYPDAGFLDEMLLKWAIAGYRIGDLDLSRKKMMQLMSEYPGSKAAAKAEQLLVVVNRKMESQ
jgi:TolA-binding protein